MVHSLEEAFRKAHEVASNKVTEIAIVGGASVYEQALPLADRIHLTVVHASIEGDARFPALEPGVWREISRSERGADERNGYDLSFIELVRQPLGSANAPEDDSPTARIK